MSENQCLIGGLLLCVLWVGHQLADGAERGIDRFEIIALHDLAELALLAAVGWGINKLQGEAEAEAQGIVAAENFVDNESVDVAGLAHEHDFFFRVEGDPLARILAAEMMSRMNPFGMRLTMLHFAMPGTNGSAFSAFITKPFQMSLRLNVGRPDGTPSFAATSFET